MYARKNNRAHAHHKCHYEIASHSFTYHKYNDEQLIADLLTENQGNLGMIVRISRSKRTAVRHTLFQPLAILDLEWEHRPKANLQRPKAVQVAWPLCSLPTDPYKLSIAMFVAEVLHHAIKQEPDSHTIFNYVLRSVQWLDVCQSGFANFHLVFLLRLTHFLGFMPNVEDAREGDYFDLRASCFTAQQPSHADFLAPRDAALVPKLMRMRYDTMRFSISMVPNARACSSMSTFTTGCTCQTFPNSSRWLCSRTCLHTEAPRSMGYSKSATNTIPLWGILSSLNALQGNASTKYYHQTLTSNATSKRHLKTPPSKRYL